MLKIGDKIRINNEDWYNTFKDKHNIVRLHPLNFLSGHSNYCGRLATILRVSEHFDEKEEVVYGTYKLDIDNGDYWWGDGMFDSDFKEDMTINYVYENFDIIKFGGFYIIYNTKTKEAISEFFENKDNAIDYVINKYNNYAKNR